MRRCGLGAAGLALVWLTGCSAEPSAPTAADLRAIDVSIDHTIAVDDGGYEPAALEVEAGDVIRLVNEGTTDHSFTGDHQRFDTRLQPGEDTTLVLTEPGEVDFHDVNEPSHTGTLTVATGG